MDRLTLDLADECRELTGLLKGQAASIWERKTAFYGWSVWDELAHLCYGDQSALLAVTAPSDFVQYSQGISERRKSGVPISAIAREMYAQYAGPALLRYWVGLYETLHASLNGLDPSARIPWFGRAMSARSFATARLMETWAHGQDIWDMLCRDRPVTSRLSHIAHLGVATYAWSFANRSQAVPDPVPYVHLTGPHGVQWKWGDLASGESVRGKAEDFCLVVTQRRHVDDTGLDYTSGTARQWLIQAQCFAGEPATPPMLGARARR